MIAVNQLDQRIAESFNAIRSGISIGEVQPGCRSDTVTVVTRRASGVLENRVELVRKRCSLAERRPRQAYPREEAPHHYILPQVTLDVRWVFV